MRVQELLDEMEPLSHAQRCRRLAGHATELRGRPELAVLLAGLAEGGQYERALAVRLAATAGDVTHLTRAMTDPDPDVSGLAIVQAVRLGVSDDAVLRIALAAPAHHRRTITRAVSRHGRDELAERLIDEVRQRWGDREAAALLAACPSGAVAARLDGLAYAVPNWAALARRHPHIVLDHAERTLAALPHHQLQPWWGSVAPGIEVAARHAPERVITLLERHWTPRHWRCAALLLDADPDRTLAVYLAHGRQPQLAALLARRAVRRRLAVLSDERLGEIGRAVRDLDDPVIDLLRSVPPSRRDAVFTATMKGVDL
ncbi:hypothetical protein ACWEPC_18095, partial [Nonomuraea sp. NPDC004297]